MLFENLSESVTDIIGSNRVAIRPTKNIVAFNVAFAKQTLVFPLLLFQLKKTSLDKGTQRKTTENELPSLTQCTA